MDSRKMLENLTEKYPALVDLWWGTSPHGFSVIIGCPDIFNRHQIIYEEGMDNLWQYIKDNEDLHAWWLL